MNDDNKTFIIREDAKRVDFDIKRFFKDNNPISVKDFKELIEASKNENKKILDYMNDISQRLNTIESKILQSNNLEEGSLSLERDEIKNLTDSIGKDIKTIVDINDLISKASINQEEMQALLSDFQDDLREEESEENFESRGQDLSEIIDEGETRNDNFKRESENFHVKLDDNFYELQEDTTLPDIKVEPLEEKNEKSEDRRELDLNFDDFNLDLKEESGAAFNYPQEKEKKEEDNASRKLREDFEGLEKDLDNVILEKELDIKDLEKMMGSNFSENKDDFTSFIEEHKGENENFSPNNERKELFLADIEIKEEEDKLSFPENDDLNLVHNKSDLEELLSDDFSLSLNESLKEVGSNLSSINNLEQIKTSELSNRESEKFKNLELDNIQDSEEFNNMSLEFNQMRQLLDSYSDNDKFASLDKETKEKIYDFIQKADNYLLVSDYANEFKLDEHYEIIRKLKNYVKG